MYLLSVYAMRQSLIELLLIQQQTDETISPYTLLLLCNLLSELNFTFNRQRGRPSADIICGRLLSCALYGATLTLTLTVTYDFLS